jgi:hypothetical protein
MKMRKEQGMYQGMRVKATKNLKYLDILEGPCTIEVGTPGVVETTVSLGKRMWTLTVKFKGVGRAIATTEGETEPVYP